MAEPGGLVAAHAASVVGDHSGPKRATVMAVFTATVLGSSDMAVAAWM